MILDLDMPPLRPGSKFALRLRLRLDSEAGALTGPDAAYALEHLRELVAEGVAPHPLPPGGYPISDPLHRLDEFAVAFSFQWRLPPELIAYLPPSPPRGPVEGLGEFDILLDG